MIYHTSFVASKGEATSQRKPANKPCKKTRQAGEVEYCDMLYTDWGEPRGVGFVRYTTEQVKGIMAVLWTSDWHTAIPTHQR